MWSSEPVTGCGATLALAETVEASTRRIRGTVPHFSSKEANPDCTPRDRKVALGVVYKPPGSTPGSASSALEILQPEQGTLTMTIRLKRTACPIRAVVAQR